MTDYIAVRSSALQKCIARSDGVQCGELSVVIEGIERG